MRKVSAFTLAEVLITLGIIGVVAAMTIPNLIANTNGAKFRSGFKKAISTLNQAALMSQAQYDFDFAGTEGSTFDTCAVDHPENKMTFCAIFNGTLSGATYLGKLSNVKRQSNTASGSSSTPYTISNAADGGIWPANNYLNTYIAYSLADGSIVAFYQYADGGCSQPIGRPMDITSAGSYLAYCSGFIDVNGTTLPNKAVTCSEGTNKNKATRNVDKPCVVNNNATNMTDVFPVIFHDATVEPATDAAKYVLTTSK